jgi:hypothetical protein
MSFLWEQDVAHQVSEAAFRRHRATFVSKDVARAMGIADAAYIRYSQVLRKLSMTSRPRN